MEKTKSYPKILQIGDKQIADIFDEDVEITEKIDGSQFGFGKINGELIVRSKGKEIDQSAPDKMFKLGVEYVQSIADKMPDNTIFYGEYLEKPRHSTLAYDRIPRNHIALFGILFDDNSMANHADISIWADALSIDVAPILYAGKSSAKDTLQLLETESYLGGQKIEGVVVKRYTDWLFLGQFLIPVKAGKYVSERFKEVHKKDWAKLNTSRGSLDTLKVSFRTEARWDKAIMHLRERNEFDGSVRDIGNVIKEVQRDVSEEEKDNIKDQLWKIFSPEILKSSTAGFVDWYKEKLAKGEFNDM